MHFKEFEKVEYEHNILFDVLFQARFPEIMRISEERPVKFQDILRKEGYPELASDIDMPILASNVPKELEELVSTTKVFHFFSEKKDWKVSLAKNFIALTCSGNYRNYADFRERLEKVLRLFSEIYEPSYFTRLGLRYRDIANKTFLPRVEQEVEVFVPEHIFPELTTPIARNIDILQKVSLFRDGDVKANVAHALAEVSGNFGHKHLANEKSYIIDVDCYSESNTKEIEDVLTKCDIFRNHCWNIFQWSITDSLRGALAGSKS